MAKKKFKKAAAKPLPEAVFPPSTLTITGGGESFVMMLTKGDKWETLESETKQWLETRELQEFSLRYQSPTLRADITRTMTRTTGAPFAVTEILSALKDFAFKETLELPNNSL